MKYFLVFICLVSVSFARQLPSFVNICKSKQNVADCLIENVNALKPRLKDGIPEMAIPSLHPLELPLAKFKVGDFEATFKNLKIWEVHQFDIQEVKLTEKPDFSIKVKVKFPHANVLADYEMHGKILVLKLDGSGMCQVNITDLDVAVEGTIKIETIKGKQHLALTSMEIKPVVGHLSVQFQDLFKDNPELNDNANKVLNNNEKIIIEEFTPLVVQIFKDFVSNIAKNIFEHYSYDELFPKN